VPGLRGQGLQGLELQPTEGEPHELADREDKEDPANQRQEDVTHDGHWPGQQGRPPLHYLVLISARLGLRQDELGQYLGNENQHHQHGEKACEPKVGGDFSHQFSNHGFDTY